MAGRQRTSFEKRQRERARQEKQAAKRARRQGNREETAGSPDAPRPTEPERLDTGEG
jgi:hypothetical protein